MAASDQALTFRRRIKDPSAVTSCRHAQRRGCVTPLTSSSARRLRPDQSCWVGQLSITWRIPVGFGITRIKTAAGDDFSSGIAQRQADDAGGAGNTVVCKADHHPGAAVAREGPDEGRIDAITDAPRDVIDGLRIFVIVAKDVCGADVVPVPDRPIVRADREDVRDDLLVHGHAVADVELVGRAGGHRHFADRGSPWRAVAQGLDLRGLDEDRVAANPIVRAHGSVEHRGVADIVEIRLCVGDERRLRPMAQLRIEHPPHRRLGDRVAREDVAFERPGVALAPEAVHHRVHIFDVRAAVVAVGEEAVQFIDRRLVGGIVVARHRMLLAVANLRAIPRPAALERNVRHPVEQELRHSRFGEVRVLQHDPEADPLAIAPRQIERDPPPVGKIEPAGPGLHLAPVGPQIDFLDERQLDEVLDRAFERLAGEPRRPDVARNVDREAHAVVRHDVARGRGRHDDFAARRIGVGAIIGERALIKPIGHRGAGVPIVIRPIVLEILLGLRGRGEARAGGGDADRSGLEEVAALELRHRRSEPPLRCRSVGRSPGSVLRIERGPVRRRVLRLHQSIGPAACSRASSRDRTDASLVSTARPGQGTGSSAAKPSASRNASAMAASRRPPDRGSRLLRDRQRRLPPRRSGQDRRSRLVRARSLSITFAQMSRSTSSSSRRRNAGAQRSPGHASVAHPGEGVQAPNGDPMADASSLNTSPQPPTRAARPWRSP